MSGSSARRAPAAEIALVVLIAVSVVTVGWRYAGGDAFARQAVVWIANVLMLTAVWAGLRARGQTWAHLGLRLRWDGWRAFLRTLAQSVAVMVAALAAFVAGGAAMSFLATGPPAADMSSYAYLRGNLPLFLLSLAGVYVVSSFGEEVLYRGFLMTRLAEMGGGSRRAWSVSVAGSAVVFGLAHFDWGIAGVVQTTFMGLALALAYLATKRNLTALVLAHAYIDTLLLVPLYLGPAGAPAA